MIRYKTVNFFKWNLIFILFFFYSCEENKSLILNPLDSIDYDFAVFFLDSDNSQTFVEPLFHSGLSSHLYVGNITNIIDDQGNN